MLRVHGSPPSLPSFVSDVGFAFARCVNEQSLRYRRDRPGRHPAASIRRATGARSRPRSAASPRAATIRSGPRAAGGSRSSTSPTGPTATSTPSATCPAISTPPRCAARCSSPRLRPVIWRTSQQPRPKLGDVCSGDCIGSRSAGRGSARGSGPTPTASAASCDQLSRRCGSNRPCPLAAIRANPLSRFDDPTRSAWSFAGPAVPPAHGPVYRRDPPLKGRWTASAIAGSTTISAAPGWPGRALLAREPSRDGAELRLRDAEPRRRPAQRRRDHATSSPPRSARRRSRRWPTIWRCWSGWGVELPPR